MSLNRLKKREIAITYKALRVVMFPKWAGIGPDRLFTLTTLQ